jgi:hypothetical protein
VFVAPATKVLTVLHIHAMDGNEPEHTRCGLPMEPQELWQPVQRDQEPVCGPCQGRTDDQGVLA